MSEIHHIPDKTATSREPDYIVPEVYNVTSSEDEDVSHAISMGSVFKEPSTSTQSTSESPEVASTG